MQAPFKSGPVIDHELANISVPPPVPIFTSISFSNDGLYILLGTSSDFHYVLDAWDLPIIARLTGHQGLERDINGHRDIEPRRGKSGEEVSWTGDSKSVISGSNDGSICIWDLSTLKADLEVKRQEENENVNMMGITPNGPLTLEPSVRLSGKGGPGHQPSRAVKFNPRLCMLASGGEDLVSATGSFDIAWGYKLTE